MKVIMKRILALCTVLLLIFSLAACSNKKDDGDNGDVNKGGSSSYSVTYNGQRIEIGADAKTLIPKLGEYTCVDGEAC